MTTERLKHTVSVDTINKIVKIIKYQFTWLTIGGNFAITSSLDPRSVDKSYRGNEICLVFTSENHTHTLTIGCQDIHGELTGRWPSFNSRTKKLSKSNPFANQQELLLRNRGLFQMNIPNDLQIEKIEVFGYKIKGPIDKELYILEEDAVMDINIDSMLKLITNQDYVLSIRPHDGNMLLEVHSDLNKFEKLVDDLSDNLSKLVYKYTIE